MARATVNFDLDEDLKNDLEQACTDMGMSMATAFTIFATKVSREKRIPFEITAEPFYSESNMARLRKIAADIESGKTVLKEHELFGD